MGERQSNLPKQWDALGFNGQRNCASEINVVWRRGVDFSQRYGLIVLFLFIFLDSLLSNG